MSSPVDDSVEAFLINECHLQRDCLASTFFRKMGFKSQQQLVAYLPNLSLTDFTKLGLPEAEATAIMWHCNKTSPKILAAKMLPRLANKYITLNIIGYAFAQHEAVHLGYLCQSYRQLLIRNYQLFKKTVFKAEKKVIQSVFELLDERWLSKRYRLSYSIGGNLSRPNWDNEKDVADCQAVLGDRLNFHSIIIPQSHLHLFSKFRPIKMEIRECTDILLLSISIPHSVVDLTLNFQYSNPLSFEGVCIRKFKQPKLLYCKQTLDILSRFATATESLTIEVHCLEEPGVMEFLAQMECKQIIIKAENLMQENLREFFSYQSKAIKFIYCDFISYSLIGQYDWAWNYFTQKCLNKERYICIDKQIEDVEVFFETMFNGSLKLFKKKNIHLNYGIPLNGNICVRNADTHTQSLHASSWDMAVLALNNYTSLTRLEIDNARNCKYQQLKVEKLSLQELIIYGNDDTSILLISDILNKSKDTLSSLSCNAKVDLSPLRNSTLLRKLKIVGYIFNSYDATLEVIRTFNNLQELQTRDDRVLLQFSKSQTLKTLRWGDTLNEINDLPQSVTKVISTECNTFDEVKQFLEKNPFVKEVETIVYDYTAAQLLDKFKHVKFNFNINNSFFTFKQCYTYLHPECKQIGIQGSEPDHQLYELLFNRIDDKKKVLQPYLTAIKRDIENIMDAPPEMMEQLQTFNEFKNCLRKDELDSSYFEKVFNKQISINDDEYLRIVVSAHDEVFQLQADVCKTVTMLQAMTDEEKKSLKREKFFHHCTQNWLQPLSDEDLTN
ncbi:hypothetical protein FGO68_gene5398 [Halteria grandinella]|uniref:Uncharacterized protein n=1 Tax=Halteria grandinella TaxID=5974 RepID=A0A8J8T6M8_HALGN|nr:hypothetical protein FGO68_gene5398 [Halteria grandinella]